MSNHPDSFDDVMDRDDDSASQPEAVKQVQIDGEKPVLGETQRPEEVHAPISIGKDGASYADPDDNPSFNDRSTPQKEEIKEE